MNSPTCFGASVPKISPLVVSEKSPIPTMWLDTSVGIKLVKIRRGEKLSNLEVERALRLRELILGLVKEGKLLCPMSDQDEEYEAKRLDSEIYPEFSRLSRGARMNLRLLVEDAQIYRAMDAYCEGREEIVLPWRIYFHKDPFRAIEREKGRRFIASVTTPPNSPLVSLRKTAKQDVFHHTEALRQELATKEQSYEAQLTVELKALRAQQQGKPCTKP